jgi:hypothetical protein
MEKLIVVVVLLISSISPARAETVRTCSSVYGGGEVCGENTTSTTVTHTVVETGAGDNQMIKMILSLAGAAALATGLYKMTYKNYFLG